MTDVSTPAPGSTVEQAALWAIIPAAGVGARMGADTPKQYLRIEGRTLLEYVCEVILATPGLKSLVIAVHADDKTVHSLPQIGDPRVQVVIGGKERADSVLAALDHLEPVTAPGDWVLVHDAARPCVEPELIARMIAQLSDHAIGGILARPITDTVKQANDQHGIESTLPRQQLWLAQTPQMFRYAALREALHQARSEGIAVTDEAMALERFGHKPLLVEGDVSNIKITYPQDLALAAWYLSNRSRVACE